MFEKLRLIQKVYKDYYEMMAMMEIDNFKNGECVMISSEHGGEHAREVWIRTESGYEPFILDGDGGGGDPDPYKDLPPTIENFEGLPSGSNINGLTVKQVVKKILYPYSPPNISIALQPNVKIQEKGTVIRNPVIKATVTKTELAIVAVRFYLNGNKIHEITSGVENGGVFEFTYNGSINSDSTFKVECDDGTTQPTSSHTINYVNRAYYGLIPEGTEVDVVIVKSLENSVLKLNKGLRWEGIKVTGGLKHMVYAYPKNQGDLTSIIDQTNFQYLNVYDKTVMQINGEPYNVYKLHQATGPDGLLQVYS